MDFCQKGSSTQCWRIVAQILYSRRHLTDAIGYASEQKLSLYGSEGIAEKCEIWLDTVRQTFNCKELGEGVCEQK